MKTTFQNYIDNPMGKGSTVITKDRRDMYKNSYSQKYGAVLLRENGYFDHALYYDKNKDRYFIHMKVPSESISKLYYDVVIEFYPIDISNNTEPHVKNYGVKFFSNDPAFVYTYAYVFDKNDMIIKELKPKISKIAFKQAPTTRNPYELPSYVKSIFFCYLYMKDRSLFNKFAWKQNSRPFVVSYLLRDIKHSDDKLAEHRELKDLEAKQKKIDKQKARSNTDIKKIANKEAKETNQPTGVNYVTPIKPKAHTSNVRRNKNVKVVKKK